MSPCALLTIVPIIIITIINIKTSYQYVIWWTTKWKVHFLLPMARPSNSAQDSSPHKCAPSLSASHAIRNQPQAIQWVNITIYMANLICLWRNTVKNEDERKYKREKQKQDANRISRQRYFSQWTTYRDMLIILRTLQDMQRPTWALFIEVWKLQWKLGVINT